MCKCLTEAIKVERFKDSVEKQHNKVLVDIEVSGACATYVMPSFSLVTCTEVKLEVEGRKTPIKSKISHTYCPFCGEKYEFKKDEERAAAKT